MTQERTRLWRNPKNGHSYAVGPEGVTLNGMPTTGVPSWVNMPHPDEVYGPLTPWAGGACPVSGDTLVRCLFRGRRPYMGPAMWPGFHYQAQRAMWCHAPAPGRPDPAADIIAYQVRIA